MRPPKRDQPPIIGLTVGSQGGPARDGQTYVRLRLTYIRAVEQCGGVPLLVPPMGDASLRRVLDTVDGLLLPGGVDVDPAHYGERPHPTVEIDSILDDLELAATIGAVERELPTLGICRGQQVLNVALGGSLIQDLPSSGKSHAQSGSQRDRRAHGFELEAGCRLAGIFGERSFEVNSHHHQAIARLAPGLRAVAWSDDGVIEAVEGIDHPWLMAVQYHPEDMVAGHEPSRRLISAFVAACAERRERPISVVAV
jgi:putative glutamine amidotransferase